MQFFAPFSVKALYRITRVSKISPLMHLLQAVLLFISLFAINGSCSGHPNPYAMNTIRSSVEKRCNPAITDFMNFIKASEPVPELDPLRDIKGELKDFLDSTCRARVNHPQCEVLSKNDTVFGQCMVKDAKTLHHCVVTSVKPTGVKGISTLDLKCWYAGSGHEFVNLLQEYDSKNGYTYLVTTHNTSPKFFKLPEN